MSRPAILLSPDCEGRNFQLDRAYADAIVAAGGLPLVAPYGAPVAELLDLACGVVITGGAFDIPPSAYGAERAPACGPLKEERTRFEWELLEAALARRLPVLGVCGGMQLLNVVLGGTLVQDIPTEIPGALPHEQKNPKDEPSHAIRIEEGSLLARAAGRTGETRVNSTHHQAVARLGRRLRASAVAPDGVVEAIEGEEGFVLGVQWHPERLLASEPWNLGVYEALVRAAARVQEAP